LSNATITLEDDSNATLNGTGNTITIDNGATLVINGSNTITTSTGTINVTGLNQITTSTDGQTLNDQQFDSSTGYETKQIDYLNGVQSDQMDFINNVESDEKWFNSAGQMTNEALFQNLNGTPVESHYETFNPPTGQLTQDQQYSTSTGYEIDQIDYSNG